MIRTTNSESTYSSAAGDRDGDKTKRPSKGSERDVLRVVLLFTTVLLACFLVYSSSDNPLIMVLPSWKNHWFSQKQTSFKMRDPPVSELERVLMNAAMKDKTVIITALNEAWAAPNSTFNLFLESFRIGIGTGRLLKHVIGVCLDSKAYDLCLQVHPHCYLINATDSDQLSSQKDYMTSGYLKLVWRRMDFLREVVTLGYNFIFTDADILWFRDPFPHFFQDIDFQIACDHYNGKPSYKSNWVNSGFTYVKANNKTIKFYEFWCDSGMRWNGRKQDQEVFNLIKNDPFVSQIGIKMRFFDTVYIGSFCEPSKDINVVYTMHANCCKGLNSKVHYLKEILHDWKQYLSEYPSGNTTMAEDRWNRPKRCGRNIR
ncbi:hypothetical protein V5N11_004527 [Cardamine amara subsp. amara]|uniref:Nucleotide-diphospho-sugar transferase domain-containing protein n=1 Tax=Cardamine amara subsp. amara TaxID=228776 RepID=A0ABD1C3D8_CARAN